MIGQALALEGRIVDPGEHAPTRRVVFDFIEQHGGRRLRARRDFRNRADFLVPVGALDKPKLAERVHAL